MANIEQAHERLNSKNWGEIVNYSVSSPTFLEWKSPTRKGKGGAETKRTSMVAGGINSQGFLVFTNEKRPYSIPKIVWIMHNGPIPDGYTIWFSDGDRLNARIENLVLQQETSELPEKYSESLKDYLEYDTNSPSTLRWKSKISKNSKQMLGDVAGSLDSSDGYWKLHGLGYYYKVHRIVWFFHYGKIPKDFFIDHINGDRSNSRIENLRLVTRNGNARNRCKNKNNTSGHNMITYYEGVNHRGTLIQRFVVAISIPEKGRINKAFSCVKYGKDNALRMAIEFRDARLKEINEAGAGYTERHGKEHYKGTK